MKAATVTREGDGQFDERGDAGAVDLRDVVEVDDDFAGALLHELMREIVEVFAGFADGQAAVDLEVVDSGGFARGNFQRWIKRHEIFLLRCRRQATAGRVIADGPHYTMKDVKNKVQGTRRHKWRVSIEEARAIQERLRERWEGQDRLGTIRTVAGVDAAFVVTESQVLKKKSRWDRLRTANRAIGCAVVFRFPEMEEVERAWAVVPLEFPYVPGFLSFREVPALLAALKKLRAMPDLLFCDGQGYAHPRRMGLASHLGIWLDRPTIGCAKSILIGRHGELGEEAGNWADLVDGGERIGAALRTRTGVKPVYVSQGNRVSLRTAVGLTLEVADGFRIPRPTRVADGFTKEVKKAVASGEW